MSTNKRYLRVGAFWLAAWLFFGFVSGPASAQFITQAPVVDDPTINRQQLTLKFDDGVETRAELASPTSANSSGPLPAVFMLGGSGLTDMDGANRPPPNVKNYKEMADNLVRNGFAVFRYNKRGVTTNGQLAPGQTAVSRTNEVLVNDAASALRLFQNQSKVDRAKIFILGHSQGTLIGVQLARRFPGLIKGLVLTGAITDWSAAFDYQLVTRYLTAATEADSDKDGMLTSEELGTVLGKDTQIYANLERNNLLYDKVLVYYPRPTIGGAGQSVQVGAILAESGIDKDKNGKLSIESELKPALLDSRSKYLDNADLLKASGETREAIQSLVNGPRLGDLLPTLNLPVYFQHGGADERIPASAVREVQNKLEAAGIATVFRLYPNLDHNFIPTETLVKIAFNQTTNLANAVPTQVLKEQADWLNTRVRALTTLPPSPVPVTPSPVPQPSPDVPIMPVTGSGNNLVQPDFSWQLGLLIGLVLVGSLALSLLYLLFYRRRLKANYSKDSAK